MTKLASARSPISTKQAKTDRPENAKMSVVVLPDKKMSSK
jgi:hypothetical protein